MGESLNFYEWNFFFWKAGSVCVQIVWYIFIYVWFIYSGAVKYVKQLRNGFCDYFLIATEVNDIELDMRQILRFMVDTEL